eukprot:gene10475-11397_t
MTQTPTPFPPTQTGSLTGMQTPMGGFKKGTNVVQRHYLTRSAIVKPHFSAWKRLLNFVDDKSLTNITGLNRQSFFRLVNITYIEEPNPRGRPKLLQNVDRVGLGLLYLGSKMGLKHLSMIFGIVPSTVSTILKEVLQRFANHLKSDEAAAVLFPDSSKMQYLASLVQEREPTAANIIGFADGLSLFVECADDEISQSMYYSGHHKATMINNVLAFSSEGKIIHATINCPGSWHDSQVAAHLMAIVEAKIEKFAICVDQGFSKTDYMEGKFVGALSNRMLKKLKNATQEVRDAETKSMTAIFRFAKQPSGE